MPSGCSVPSCTNQQFIKDPKITYHRVPTDENNKRKWIEAVSIGQEKTSDYNPENFKNVCSDHFLPSDYSNSKRRKILLRSAVPSVFKSEAKNQHNDHSYAKTSNSLEESHDPEIALVNTISSNQAVINFPDDNLSVKGQRINDHDLNKKETTPTKSIRTKYQLKCRKCIYQRKAIYWKPRCRNCMSYYQENCRLRNLCNKLKKKNKQLKADNHKVPPVPEKSKFLVENIYKNGNITSNKKVYDKDVKDLALNLHVASPKCYRQSAPLLCLPTERTLRRWTSVIDCTPGFFYNVLLAMKDNFSKEGDFSGNQECSLVIDGMHLKKGMCYDSGLKMACGTIDYGGILPEPEIKDLATEAYVFLAVGIRSPWQVPIGYILSNGSPSGEDLANIINAAIIRLTDVGAVVRNVTMDGAASNINAFTTLGAKLLEVDPSKPSQSIEHPLDKDIQINASLDSPHMLKLGRNNLAEYKIFISPTGFVRWELIDKLQQLQEHEGLSLAPKLKKRNINFKNLKMKVYIAGQTLSRHVGDAIKHLSQVEYELPDGFVFKDVEATVEFIYNINDLFDLTNSRSTVVQCYFKKPISAASMDEQISHLVRLMHYFYSLKTLTGQPIHKSPIRCFVIGFISIAMSIINISKIMFQTPHHIEPHHKYFLTARLQQDPLEHLFGIIRGSGGYNNNPTCVQLKYRMKKLLMVNKMIPSVNENPQIYMPSSYSTLFVKCDEESENIPEILLKYSAHIDESSSLYLKDILYYMSGWVVRAISRNIKCLDCLSALINQNLTLDHDYCAPIPDDVTPYWTLFKQRGPLIYASSGVIKILEMSESIFRLAINTDLSNIKKSILVYLVTEKLSFLDMFPGLSKHYLENSVLEDHHCTQLIKIISGKYFESRIRTWSKNYTVNLKVKGGNLREKLSRTVIFSNA